MQDIGIDITATLIAVAFVVVCACALWLLKGWRKPSLRMSDTELFFYETPSWRQRAAPLPTVFFWIALTLFVLAFIDPHGYVERDADHPEKEQTESGRIPTEGIAIYLVLDNSVSMLEPLSVASASGRRLNIPKIKMLKDVTKKFVSGDSALGLEGRPNDLLGIVTFARSAQVVSPLTLDHKNIVSKLDALDVNRDESQRGTALGYAIFKAANLITATRHYGNEVIKEGDPAYDIKNSVILLVTDGFQETNPEDAGNPLRSIDIVDAINFAKENNVRVYIVNIDPKMTSERFADHRKLFKLVTEQTGGKFFFVDSLGDLANVYTEFDQLEKSILPSHSRADKEMLPHLYKRVSLYHTLIPAGMLALFLGILLQTTLLRRVP